MSPKSQNEVLNMQRVQWLSGARTGATIRHKQKNGRYINSVPRTYTFQHKQKKARKAIIRQISQNDIQVRTFKWPDFPQHFLAFATLLFLTSIEGFIFTALTIQPGLLGQTFSETQCKVVQTVLHGNTSCHVNSFNNQGDITMFPCLQIYVILFVDNSTSGKQETVRYIPEIKIDNSDNKDIESKLNFSVKALQLRQNESENAVNKSASRSNKPRLLFQNEFSFLNGDYLHRRCSYLPTNCPSDESAIMSDIFNYAHNWGLINKVINCFYRNDRDHEIILKRKVSDQVIVCAILLPLIGLLISIICCRCFWQRYSKQLSSLYVYNSW